MRLQDAAADAARLVARGEAEGRAGAVVAGAVTGAGAHIERRGDLVCVTASAAVRAAGLLPLTLRATSCALAGRALMAGAVVTVGALACLASFTLGLAVVGGATVAGQRAAGAADAAALAAADAASGAVLGRAVRPRGRGRRGDRRTRRRTCEVEGLVATVTVEDTYAGMAVRASAPGRSAAYAVSRTQ